MQSQDFFPFSIQPIHYSCCFSLSADSSSGQQFRLILWEKVLSILNRICRVAFWFLSQTWSQTFGYNHTREILLNNGFVQLLFTFQKDWLFILKNAPCLEKKSCSYPSKIVSPKCRQDLLLIEKLCFHKTFVLLQQVNFENLHGLPIAKS